MDEETLREVFEECLRDAPAADPKAKQGNVLARLFKRNVGAGDTDATKKEIEQAAHYIVERFGAVPDDYDEDEDDDQVRRGESLCFGGGCKYQPKLNQTPRTRARGPGTSVRVISYGGLHAARLQTCVYGHWIRVVGKGTAKFRGCVTAH